MYAKKFIEDLIDCVPIEDEIGVCIKLKKTRTLYRGLCPFHEEKTPSLVVYPRTQSFHCHGCGASGNVVTFLMNYDNSSFVDVIESLCRKYKIPIRRIGKKGLKNI